MRRPGPALTALAEVRQRALDARARAFEAGLARAASLGAEHAELAAAVDGEARAQQGLRDTEHLRLSEGRANVGDLVRAADYFAAADAVLAGRRIEVARSRQRLEAFGQELARAKTELGAAHAEHKVATNLLEQRTAEERNRSRRAFEDEVDDALVARRTPGREGSS